MRRDLRSRDRDRQSREHTSDDASPLSLVAVDVRQRRRRGVARRARRGFGNRRRVCAHILLEDAPLDALPGRGVHRLELRRDRVVERVAGRRVRRWIAGGRRGRLQLSLRRVGRGRATRRARGADRAEPVGDARRGRRARSRRARRARAHRARRRRPSRRTRGKSRTRRDARVAVRADVAASPPPRDDHRYDTWRFVRQRPAIDETERFFRASRASRNDRLIVMRASFLVSATCASPHSPAGPWAAGAMDGDGRGDAASVEARDRLPAAARPGGEAASVDDHDDSDFDRVSVVSGASEWSDSASVRSGYTGLSGVSDADHRYADAGAVVRREAREAAGRAGYPDRERRGVTRERDDDGASVSDASSDLSTSDDEFAARRLLQGRIPPRKARDRSLAMRLGDAAVRSHAMASEADAMRDDRVSLGGGRDEAGATFRRDGPSRRSDGGSREDDDVQTRADRGGSARPVLGTLNRVTLVEACATGDVRIAKHTLERLRRETTSFSSRHPPPSDTKQNVENFFDVDALDFDGRAALHAAVELGDARGFDIVRFLCENAGADVEVKGAMGIRPLHVAAYCGAAPRCVAYLLSRGARPNLGDDDGAAALHWAASSGKSLCVSALLRADDVDPDVVNDKGALAEDLVDENDVATRDAFAFANEAFQPHALARDGRLATLRRALSEKFDVARVAEDAPRARRARRGLATLSIDSGKRFSPPPSVFKDDEGFRNRASEYSGAASRASGATRAHRRRRDRARRVRRDHGSSRRTQRPRRCRACVGVRVRGGSRCAMRANRRHGDARRRGKRTRRRASRRARGFGVPALLAAPRGGAHGIIVVTDASS